jgi:hypothetical protein
MCTNNSQLTKSNTAPSVGKNELAEPTLTTLNHGSTFKNKSTKKLAHKRHKDAITAEPERLNFSLQFASKHALVHILLCMQQIY